MRGLTNKLNGTQEDMAKMIPKMSDAGSKQSYITYRKGLPKTLWQKGAVFTTRMSRANVSAGEHVKQYQGAHPPGIGPMMN